MVGHHAFKQINGKNRGVAHFFQSEPREKITIYYSRFPWYKIGDISKSSGKPLDNNVILQFSYIIVNV